MGTVLVMDVILENKVRSIESRGGTWYFNLKQLLPGVIDGSYILNAYDELTFWLMLALRTWLIWTTNALYLFTELFKK